MRKLIRCSGGCDQLVSYYQTYKAKITDFHVMQGLPRSSATEIEYIGRICRSCAEKAGYTIKRKKKEKKNDAYQTTLITS